jgi:hypothetical protein
MLALGLRVVGAQVCALFLVLAPPTHGQARALREGDRVRVTLTPVTLGVTGRVKEFNADSVTVVPTSGIPVALPWSQVTRLSVYQRRARAQGALHAAKWGLAVGTVVGVISLLTPMPEGEDFNETTLALEAVLDGALVGAVVGALYPARRWRDADIPETRGAVAIAAAARARAPRKPPSSLAGMTPAVELTAGATSIALPGSEFPGIAVALAANVALSPTRGFALVGDADLAYLRTGVFAGPRFWLRTQPLFSGRTTYTWFAQFLAGSVRGGESGVIRSQGGRAIQPGFGVDIGSRSLAARIQWDYSRVKGSYIEDSRVPGRDIDALTLERIIVGVTMRSVPW